MATYSSEQEFYDEVDRARYRPGCGGLALAVVLIAGICGLIWYISRYLT